MTVPKVMIVDDDGAIRDMVSVILARQGIGVLAASGAQECLDFLRDGFRGVILMDIMMPEKNGWETIREIEKADLLNGNIVVMLTSMNSPTEEMEGLQEIVMDYITKPFAPAAFFATIRKYLGFLEQGTLRES